MTQTPKSTIYFENGHPVVVPPGVQVAFTSEEVTSYIATCSRCGRSEASKSMTERDQWMGVHATDHLRWTLNASTVSPGAKVGSAMPGELIGDANKRLNPGFLFFNHNDRIFVCGPAFSGEVFCLADDLKGVRNVQ